MKIKLTAIIECEDKDIAFDDLSIESSVGLLGKVVNHRIKYDIDELDLHKYLEEELNDDI
jgi:hypothetical protein